MISFFRLLLIAASTTLLGCGTRIIYVAAEKDGGMDSGDVSQEPGLADSSMAHMCGPIDEIPAGLVRIGVWDYDSTTQSFRLPDYCSDAREPFGGNRQISVGAFWLDRSPIPNSCYAECVVRGACTPPEHDRRDPNSYSWLDSEKADYPVYTTNEQARRFCEWRGGYLPTLAQLARAAQGDSDIPGVTELTLAQIRCHEGIEADLDLCRRLGWITIPPSNPYPVMENEYDVGPFGTRDIHGSITEWTRTDIRSGSSEFCALEDGASDFASFPDHPSLNQYSTINFAYQINYAFESRTLQFYFARHPSVTVSYQLGFRCAFDQLPDLQP